MATKVEKRNGNYRARVSYVDEAGKQRFKSFTAETAKEVKFLAAQFDLERKHMSKPANITLREAMERFIADRENILSPSTVKGYYQLIRNAYGTIIDVRLGKLTKEHIQKAINEYSAHHSPKSVRNALAFVSMILKDIYPSLYSKIKVAKAAEKDIIIPTEEQIIAILHRTKGTEMYLPILLGVLLGLRRSEIFGLSWEDIHFEKNMISIRKAMVQDKHNCYVLKDTKTQKSRRDLEMPAVIRDELEKLDISKPLFNMNLSQFTDRYRWVASRVGAPLGFHTTRHYNASIMELLNVPDKYAMARTGHTTIRMLKKYKHPFQLEKAKIARRMEEHFIATIGV